MPNPVGLAAGYDKNAEVIAPLSKLGFGFLEVGAATPRAQPGNPKPRLFRLTEDAAAINRFGFNNDGMQAIADRLEAVRAPVPVSWSAAPSWWILRRSMSPRPTPKSCATCKAKPRFTTCWTG